jgi:Mlc titration factor MtfA (ptsG expression regulator)
MGLFSGRRKRGGYVLARPFPDSWLAHLRDNVALYRLLPEPQQAQLRDAVPAFIAGKNWEGCAGLVVTDEMRVTIAAHACLLALGLEGYCFDKLKTILVYPGGFLASAADPLGGAGDAQQLHGEAHYRGPVVLSWWHARRDGRRMGTTNVVLHEFAHKLAEWGD